MKQSPAEFAALIKRREHEAKRDFVLVGAALNAYGYWGRNWAGELMFCCTRERALPLLREEAAEIMASHVDQLPCVVPITGDQASHLASCFGPETRCLSQMP